ncbi:MAG TPA: sugar transferase [Phycisphaerae bacterium]|nr:sugar transferase [Phycisphaerae bacterium]HPS51982.1 sugar transferase [Phycisphaerae bacterium]
MMVKRLFDIIVSMAVLLLIWPLLLLIAVLIRLESHGHALFSQRRAGYMGKPFTLYKFRTMFRDVEPYGNSPKSGDDPRLTRIGKFLRETSLDELPQLWNVFTGSMSLVGPRPLYERQAEKWNERQKRRLNVRPGITGWAQIKGRGEIPIEEKIELDIYYLDNWSLMLDLKIILYTFLQAIGKGQGIYEKRYSLDSYREADVMKKH